MSDNPPNVSQWMAPHVPSIKKSCKKEMGVSEPQAAGCMTELRAFVGAAVMLFEAAADAAARGPSVPDL